MSVDPKPFSIGEFSQISGLSVKTLRFYDEKNLLKPAQGGATTGYRFYDAASAERARIVARLRELQFSLDDIARILAEAKRRGLAFALPTREIYLKAAGLIFQGNPRRYLTEIQLSLREA